MYSRCIRCRRSLGKNRELPHLPVGGRVAFDSAKGRVWVICERCDQWNLVPIEERWEILGECDTVAKTAEVHGPGDHLAIARTSSGLELLRVGAMSDADVANWRYGRQLVERRRLLWWIVLAFMGVAGALGLRAGVALGSGWLGLYVAVLTGALFGFAWANPPHLRPIRIALDQRAIVVWPWRIGDLAIGQRGAHGRPAIVVPGRPERQLTGGDAAELLARMLPVMNDADCASTSLGLKFGPTYGVDLVRQAVDRATHAEHAARDAGLRPWEVIAADNTGIVLRYMSLTDRLALEIAATEEIEQRELARSAERAGPTWQEEELIAGIADDLLVPEQIRARLERAKDQ